MCLSSSRRQPRHICAALLAPVQIDKAPPPTGGSHRIRIRVRHDNQPHDGHGILRTAAQHNAVNVGVYASVLSPGTIRRGDAVTLS
jgi:hypothetical protein